MTEIDNIEILADHQEEKPLGIVYILTNPAMPGIIKIGKTADLMARVSALSLGTSVPMPFEVAYAAYVEDTGFVERALHAAFSLHRLPGREFFRLPVANAIAALSLAEVSQVVLNTDEDDTASDFVSEVRVRAAVRANTGLGVVEALKRAGGSVDSNQQLAALMGVCGPEASKRVREVEHLLVLTRVGKEKRISLKQTA